MNEEFVVLKAIEAELEKLDPKVVGEVTADEQAGCLTLLDEKLTVWASIFHDEEVNPSIAHVHVTSKIASLSDEPLDACVIGVSADREDGLAQAGRTWVTMVSDPILSLYHAAAIGNAAHFSGDERWGVQGCHGFVGSAILRFAEENGPDLETISQSAMFDYVAELTPGGLVHIVKSTLSQNGQGGWKRQLEIDGHSASYVDEDWRLDPPLPNPGNVIISRFAVYHYADQPDIAAERQALDDAITAYVQALQENSTLDPTAVAHVLVEKGHRAEIAHWIDHFAPLAFGRVVLVNIGVSFPNTYLLAQRGGHLSTPRELMRNPVFARARALGWHFRASTDYHDGFERAALCSAEFNALNNALHAGSKPENLTALPPIIPGLGVSHADVAQATETYLAQRQAERGTPVPTTQKSWWQFWK